MITQCCVRSPSAAGRGFQFRCRSQSVAAILWQRDDIPAMRQIWKIYFVPFWKQVTLDTLISFLLKQQLFWQPRIFAISHPIEQCMIIFFLPSWKFHFQSGRHNSASTYHALAELIANSQIFNAHQVDIEQGACNGFFLSINPKENLFINTDFV